MDDKGWFKKQSGSQGNWRGVRRDTAGAVGWRQEPRARWRGVCRPIGSHWEVSQRNLLKHKSNHCTICKFPHSIFSICAWPQTSYFLLEPWFPHVAQIPAGRYMPMLWSTSPPTVPDSREFNWACLQNKWFSHLQGCLYSPSLIYTGVGSHMALATST